MRKAAPLVLLKQAMINTDSLLQIQLALRVLAAWGARTVPSHEDVAMLRTLVSPEDTGRPADELACEVVQRELRRCRTRATVRSARA
jgi:hypothetical protein